MCTTCSAAFSVRLDCTHCRLPLVHILSVRNLMCKKRMIMVINKEAFACCFKHWPVGFAWQQDSVPSSCCCLVVQAVSTLLWRPLGNHTFRPTWNALHKTWGRVTMAAGFIAVNLGIWVAGIGWPYYLLFAVQVGGILGVAALQQPTQVSNATFPV